MMKQRIAAFILIAALIVTVFCGCGAVEKANVGDGSSANSYERFSETIYTGNISVITDNKTGCQYLVYRSANGTGLTVLETKD